MTGGRMRPEITIFAGRFGSGKTEAAINLSLLLAQRGGLAPDKQQRRASRVILIDLDIVTPYFRSRETAGAMQEQGVDVIAPSVIGQHLDTPAITPQIRGAIQQRERPAVLDVGGDRQGARALGQFSVAIRQRGYTLHFVVNPYRPYSSTVQELADSISEIEASARLRVTDLVSNPNLMGETTAEKILEGHAAIGDFAGRLELPIAYVCIERRWVETLGPNHFSEPILALDRFFVQPWE